MIRLLMLPVIWWCLRYVLRGGWGHLLVLWIGASGCGPVGPRDVVPPGPDGPPGTCADACAALAACGQGWPECLPDCEDAIRADPRAVVALGCIARARCEEIRSCR